MKGPLRGVLTGLAIVAAATFTSWLVYDIAARPLLAINVTGSFEHVSRQALEGKIAAAMSPGFFAVEVERIAASARELPWVKNVRVRRVWPDSLEVSVEEKQAVARWGARHLLEQDGSAFEPSSLGGLDSLPWLLGPQGREAEVLAAWRALTPALSRIPGGRIARLRLTGRGDWYLTLENGIEVVTDREPGEGLLMRIAPALSALLGDRLGEVERIDMRYGHGFAVRWRNGASQGNGTS